MNFWREITGYEGLYEVSSLGEVRNARTLKKLAYHLNNKGYCALHLFKQGKNKGFLVHRLVAMTFIPNPNNHAQINHKDSNKLNNAVENLEWCDQRQNYNHGMKLCLYSKNDEHYFSKLSNRDIEFIPILYRIGFTRATVSKILGINYSSLEAIEKGISYRALNIEIGVPIYKYKDCPNIVIPSDVREYFRDNTVLNTLIAQGKVSV